MKIALDSCVAGLLLVKVPSAHEQLKHQNARALVRCAKKEGWDLMIPASALCEALIPFPGAPGLALRELLKVGLQVVSVDDRVALKAAQLWIAARGANTPQKREGLGRQCFKMDLEIAATAHVGGADVFCTVDEKLAKLLARIPGADWELRVETPGQLIAGHSQLTLPV